MRKKLNSQIVFIARTDALQSCGFDYTIRRLEAVIAAGADVAFLEAIETKEQAVELCKIFGSTPVVYGMMQGASTPLKTIKEAQKMDSRLLCTPHSALGLRSLP